MSGDGFGLFGALAITTALLGAQVFLCVGVVARRTVGKVPGIWAFQRR